ncbi:MAG: hypothetical protein M3140_09980, partial [Actinomycetota bacterium]|nr:hypothetical protein [Actinomycetota bacterium]
MDGSTGTAPTSPDSPVWSVVVMAEKKSTATLLVEIATDLYVFGCVSEERGGVAGNPGRDPVAVHTFASPKNRPEQKRPLPDIRPDLAEVFQATYGTVPNATALGDAMTVLEGIARKAEPIQVGAPTLALLLGGGNDSPSSLLISMAKETYTFGIMTTGDVYGVPVEGPNVARLLRGGRRSLRSELAAKYYDKYQTAAPGQALTDALAVLEGGAQAAAPTDVALRVAADTVTGRLVLDLGDDEGRAVVIGADGWQVVA